MALRDRISAAARQLRVDSVPEMSGPDLRDAMFSGGGIGRPRASQSGDMQVFTDLSDPALATFLRGGTATASGAVVNERTALGVATAWRCASIICGVASTLPADVMLRESENSRTPAVDAPFRNVLTVKPNNRQTPSEFISMLQLHKLQRGNGYAWKIMSLGRVIALWPLDSNRMQPVRSEDYANPLKYRYTRLDGAQVEFTGDEILHLRGLSWDGVEGLSVIRFMAESLGLNIQSRRAAANMFRNGQFTPGYLKSPNPLSDKAYERLKDDLDDNAGVDSSEAGKMKILEEGLEFQAASPTAVDAQLIEIMGFSRTDIGMFYGVPPHLYGDTDKSTSWGSGIEQQNIGFLQYTVNPHLKTWKDALKRDCLSGKGDDPRLYVHFDLRGFLQADAAGRSTYLSRALGSGGGRPWMTQNEARAAEDMPPRDEAWADQLPEIGAGRITESVVDPNAAPDTAPLENKQ